MFPFHTLNSMYFYIHTGNWHQEGPSAIEAMGSGHCEPLLVLLWNLQWWLHRIQGIYMIDIYYETHQIALLLFESKMAMTIIMKIQWLNNKVMQCDSYLFKLKCLNKTEWQWLINFFSLQVLWIGVLAHVINKHEWTDPFTGEIR